MPLIHPTEFTNYDRVVIDALNKNNKIARPHRGFKKMLDSGYQKTLDVLRQPIIAGKPNLTDSLNNSLAIHPTGWTYDNADPFRLIILFDHARSGVSALIPPKFIVPAFFPMCKPGTCPATRLGTFRVGWICMGDLWSVQTSGPCWGINFMIDSQHPQ
jgi:hypothetical protein